MRAVQAGASFDLTESKVRSKSAAETETQSKKENDSQASMREFLQRVSSAAVPRANPQPSPRGLLDALDTPAEKQGQVGSCILDSNYPFVRNFILVREINRHRVVPVLIYFQLSLNLFCSGVANYNLVYYIFSFGK